MAMERESINLGGGPRLPYSQAVKAGNFVFTAGQIGLDRKTGKLVTGGIKAETRQVLENLSAVLHAADSSLEKVLKTTVFIADLAGDFRAMNEVYRDFFPAEPPARSTVEVKGLALSAHVEIEAVALI